MRVRALDSEGDWTWGKGQNDYLTGVAAVMQEIRCNVSSFLGDCFFDVEGGIDWFNLLGGKNQLAIEVAVSTQIINTPNVTKLVQLSATLNPITRALTLFYQVTTSYSGQTVVTDHFTVAPDTLITQDNDVLVTQDGERIGT